MPKFAHRKSFDLANNGQLCAIMTWPTVKASMQLGFVRMDQSGGLVEGFIKVIRPGHATTTKCTGQVNNTVILTGVLRLCKKSYFHL